MAQIMKLLNEDAFLTPGSHGKQVVRKMISEKIDRFWPEGALVQAIDTKSYVPNPIRHYVTQPVVKN